MKCCSLYSGSSGNSIYVEGPCTKLLIDAGVSGKKIEEALCSIGTSLSEIDAILVTHEHSDHVLSIGYISKKYDIPVYASTKTWSKLEEQAYRITLDNRMTFDKDSWFEIGELEVLPFETPHDAIDPCGFSIIGNHHKVTIATDIGHINSYLIDHMRSSDILFLESNHDKEMLKCGSYPYFLKQRILGSDGHLCNDEAAKLIASFAQTGMRNFILGHLSNENNFPELAMQTTSNSLNELGITPGVDVFLEVAPRFGPSTMLDLN